MMLLMMMLMMMTMMTMIDDVMFACTDDRSTVLWRRSQSLYTDFQNYAKNSQVRTIAALLSVACSITRIDVAQSMVANLIDQNSKCLVGQVCLCGRARGNTN
jgi:hypothetical protein